MSHENGTAERGLNPGRGLGLRSPGMAAGGTGCKPPAAAVVIMLLSMFVMLAMIGAPSGEPAAADEAKIIGSGSVPLEGPLDFSQCAHLALHQSPQLTKSSLEIDVRRLDESDSKYALIPQLTLQTSYYFDASDDKDVDSPGYAIAFTTGSYNPLESYFTYKVRKVITRIAVLGHLHAISKGLHALADKLLQLEGLVRGGEVQDQIISLAQEKLEFVKKRHDLGTVTLVEVQVAAQQLAMAEAEKSVIDSTRANILAGLKAFLGLAPEQKLELDLVKVRQQILGGFDPASASLEQAKAHSFELRIQELKQQLQNRSVSAAYSRFLPTLSFGVRSTDPIYSDDDGQDYFVSLGVSLPLWDGMERVHNISRQKIIRDQFAADGQAKENDLAMAWRAAEAERLNTGLALKLAASGQELARLKESQSRIRFNTNGQMLSTLLDDRMNHLTAQKEVLAKSLEYDLAALRIRYLCGDLFDSYVSVTDWQE